MIPNPFSDRVEHFASLIRAGQTLAEVGQAEVPPISRERVRQVLAAAGLTVDSLRPAHCSVCGAVMPNRTRLTQMHYCANPSCQRVRKRQYAHAYYRVRREREGRVLVSCAFCGREFITPRPDALLHYCATTACCTKAANWRYHHQEGRKEKLQAYRQTPEQKARVAAYFRAYYQRNKAKIAAQRQARSQRRKAAQRELANRTNAIE